MFSFGCAEVNCFDLQNMRRFIVSNYAEREACSSTTFLKYFQRLYNLYRFLKICLLNN